MPALLLLLLLQFARARHGVVLCIPGQSRGTIATQPPLKQQQRLQ
jgi:hypothetical protein